jgi:3-oxoacyl-[acyl-carrier protein] reductase
MPKIAVITGASKGIGAALAQKLAKRGLTVYAIARSAEDLNALKKNYPCNIIPIVADLSNKESITHVLTALKNVKIDFLVNNAAVLGVKLLEDMEYDDYQNLFNVNVISATFLTSQLIKTHAFNKEARIMFLDSRAVDYSSDGIGAYAASKGSIRILTSQFTKEYPHLKFGRFIPGEVNTQMQRQLREFPLTSRDFIEAEKKGQVMRPELSALWLSWELLEASTQQFSMGGSIYDPKHRSQWLPPEETLPMPQAGMDGLTP